jgi:hypothetical protein
VRRNQYKKIQEKQKHGYGIFTVIVFFSISILTNFIHDRKNAVHPWLLRLFTEYHRTVEIFNCIVPLNVPLCLTGTAILHYYDAIVSM